MKTQIEGNAVVYCEGAFNTSKGRIAQDLVMHTDRYNIICVIDSNCPDIKSKTKIVKNLEEAINYANSKKKKLTHLVIGVDPLSCRLDRELKEVIMEAIQNKLNIDSGLNEYLTEQVGLMRLAETYNVKFRDLKKPKSVGEYHLLSGKIENVDSVIVTVLGTDVGVGKRRTARSLQRALKREGYKAEIVGTGQTAWLEGVKYGVILNALTPDYIPGEIEHAVYSAWENERPHFIIIEGQGGLISPAHPGGLEIITAIHPDIIILQHDPKRKIYEDSKNTRVHSITKQIKVIELVSSSPVQAIVINHENIDSNELEKERRAIRSECDLPVFDLSLYGDSRLSKYISNISGRINSKKVRFKRRKIPA